MHGSPMRRSAPPSSPRCRPLQKSRIIRALQSRGHTVGYLGDGINDAAALRDADVGISVDTAVDIAKESADIILLEKSLLVLEEGVIEGRKTFANIIKYIKMTASSNFGNVFSVLVASAFLPFLPMLPIQLLMQNLLYDISQVSIPWDDVDQDYLKQPRKWDAGDLARFMVFIGPISSIFDILTFVVMWYVFRRELGRAPVAVPVGLVRRRAADADADRAHDPHAARSVHSEPRGPPVILLTATVMAVGIYVPFSPLASHSEWCRCRVLFPVARRNPAQLLPAHAAHEAHLYPAVRTMAVRVPSPESGPMGSPKPQLRTDGSWAPGSVRGLFLLEHVRCWTGRQLLRLASGVLYCAIRLDRRHVISRADLRFTLSVATCLEKAALVLLFGPKSAPPPTGAQPGRFAMTVSLGEAAINLAITAGLSAAIGFERQWRNRLAGLRTNTLVALGAASFVIFAGLIPGEASPTRVAAQVVSGIGFLGAGLIFREGMSVRGLNTAATLWCSAAIGVLAGAGYPLYAALSTGFVLFVNLLLRPIVRFINRQPLAVDRARDRIRPIRHLSESRRGARPRAAAAGACRERLGASTPRQQRSSGDGTGCRHRVCHQRPSRRR